MFPSDEGPYYSGVLSPPVKIFRGCQKLEKGTKNCITNDIRMPFVGRNSEFGKTQERYNSLVCRFMYSCI